MHFCQCYSGKVHPLEPRHFRAPNLVLCYCEDSAVRAMLHGLSVGDGSVLVCWGGCCRGQYLLGCINLFAPECVFCCDGQSLLGSYVLRSVPPGAGDCFAGCDASRAVKPAVGV